MAFEIFRAGGPRRTWQVGCALLALGATSIVGGLFQTTSSAPNGGNLPCPTGTSLVAKFNYGGQYVFEKPAGSESVVTISGGTASGGSWSSTATITAIVVKGGPGAVIAT